MARPPDIAIFDLDRTLTKGGSFTPFMVLVAREEPEKFFYFIAVLFQVILYALRMKTRTALKEYMIKAFMHGMSKNQTAKASSAFLQKLENQNKFFRDGVAAIAGHKKNGDKIVIATAAMDFYAGDIAKKLGADDLIASESVWEKGIIVPLLKGGNCYGPEKAKRVQAYLAGQKTARVWFYSDSHTDVPTFELADKRVAVNPTRVLRKIAERRGYDIQNWN